MPRDGRHKGADFIMDITGKRKVLGGTMIIAGTAIGAGMLALPMSSAGMWLYWSLALMVATWFLMLRSSQAILEVNAHYAPGSSFHTLVLDTLGQGWSVVNGLAVASVLYILVYAYVSGGGSVVRQTSMAVAGIHAGEIWPGLAFSFVLTVCVWWSTKFVDRFSVVLMGGMALTFVLSVTGMISQIRIPVLLGMSGEGPVPGRVIFLWGALSTYLTSFCFHASVPSLVKYFGKNNMVSVDKCLRYGTLIAFICYTVWLVAADGIISRDYFRNVIAAGGNVGDLIRGAGAGLDGSFILRMLEAFSFLAVATSFLGAGLGLFDYMADLCKFDDSPLGRAKTALVTFVPPTLCGLIWPRGFLYAIGWAGLAATIWSVLVPALMLHASRKKFRKAGYRAPWGRALVPLLILYGCTTAVCHILYMLNMLPEYK